MKTFWLSVVVGCLLGVGVSLGSADFLLAYHGVAVGHRPVPGSDGVDDTMRRFVLDQGDGWTEVVLPVDAFSSYSLPLAPFGVPPAERPEEAPAVEKTRFSWSVRVGDRAVSLLGPANLFFGLLAGLVVVLGRNVAVAGSPFRLLPTPDTSGKRGKRPKVGQAAAGRPAAPPKPARPQKGPPPRRGKGRRNKKRR